MRARRWLTLAALSTLAPVVARGQISSSPRVAYSGTLDYVVTGASLRPNSDQSNPCAMTGNGDAAVSGIPVGATIVAAWLYWAGSGPADLFVKLNGSDLTADQSWSTSAIINGSSLSFFGAVKNVTGLVSGNGSYTVSQLAVTNNGAYCDSEVVLGGWSLVVVYSVSSAPTRTIQIRDGLAVVRNGSSTVSFTDFGPGASARASLLTWEGDPGIIDGESVVFNGTTVSGSNPFNSASTALGGANTYGMDFDSYDLTALQASNGSGTLTMTTGNDAILPQALVTAVDAGLVDVTPKGLGTPVVRLGGGSYSQSFFVENRSGIAESYDLIARVQGAAFVTVDSITGPGMVGVRTRADSLQVSIAARTTQTYVVWYRVASGAIADDVLYLLARSTRLPTQAYARSEGWAEIRRGAASLTMSKSVTPNASIAPGMDLSYSMTVTNGGVSAAQGIVVSDNVPVELEYKMASVSQTLPAGITVAVDYSNDGGATWTYVPASAACGAAAGYDRCVLAVRWRLTGSLAPAGAQSVILGFVARVR